MRLHFNWSNFQLFPFHSICCPCVTPRCHGNKTPFQICSLIHKCMKMNRSKFIIFVLHLNCNHHYHHEWMIWFFRALIIKKHTQTQTLKATKNGLSWWKLYRICALVKVGKKRSSDKKTSTVNDTARRLKCDIKNSSGSEMCVPLYARLHMCACAYVSACVHACAHTFKFECVSISFICKPNNQSNGKSEVTQKQQQIPKK